MPLKPSNHEMPPIFPAMSQYCASCNTLTKWTHCLDNNRVMAMKIVLHIFHQSVISGYGPLDPQHRVVMRAYCTLVDLINLKALVYDIFLLPSTISPNGHVYSIILILLC